MRFHNELEEDVMRIFDEEFADFEDVVWEQTEGIINEDTGLGRSDYYSYLLL